jgi:hypothetical protein
MLLNANVNKEVNTGIDAMEASKKLMEQLKGAKIVVKPTLPEGHYTGLFKGIKFIESRHSGAACMAVEIAYSVAETDYTEEFPLDGKASPEAQAAALGQIQRYMQQIAEQFGLVGIDINFDVLNQHINEAFDIKVYQKEFQTKAGKTALARKIGFWKKPEESEAQKEAAVTAPTI